MQPQPVAVSPVMAPLQPGEQYLQPASDLPLVINEADRSQPLRLTSVGTMCRGCPTNDHPNGGKYVDVSETVHLCAKRVRPKARRRVVEPRPR
jgi:hypothetical protein